MDQDQTGDLGRVYDYVGFPQWRTSRRVDSGHPRGRKGLGWRIETLREILGSVSGRLGMAGARLHLEDGALKLYAGPPEGGLGEGPVLRKSRGHWD